MRKYVIKIVEILLLTSFPFNFSDNFLFFERTVNAESIIEAIYTQLPVAINA